MNLEIIKMLKKPTLVMWSLTTAFIVFDISYYMMAYLPGYKNNMCVFGAGLTAWNLVFSAVLSLLFGLMLAGIVEVMSKQGKFAKSSSASGIGLVLGGMTVFCPLCTLPALSFFGLSFTFSFFTTYNLYIKILSILFIGVGLYFINSQLKNECIVCKITDKSCKN